MKKLKLESLGLNATEVLTRTELRNVLGGTGSGGCGASTCTSDKDCANDVGNTKCHFVTCQSTGNAANFCGV